MKYRKFTFSKLVAHHTRIKSHHSVFSHIVRLPKAVPANYVARSMHRSVDHLITHRNTEHITTGWRKAARSLAHLQLI